MSVDDSINMREVRGYICVDGDVDLVTLDHLINNNVTSLILSKQGNTADYSFLQKLPYIERLEISISVTSESDYLHDLAPVNNLKSLRRLKIRGRTRGEIEFHHFTDLNEVDISWHKKYTNLFDLPKLRILSLDSCNLSDLACLSKLNNLSELYLSKWGKLTSLNGVESLTNLEHLKVEYASSLASIKGIGSLKSLKCVVLNRCSSITDLRLLSEVCGLKCLELDAMGRLQTINFLSGKYPSGIGPT